ncbi:hypothetical protein X970_09510 [Pseudomonas monteilii SB3101]|uniref:Uncharacterized protein n=1 Tax=Pseudomonas monteilii SB3101 TaxID=1435058 RepID=V9V8L3_9PSED|nr:hypothetical protein X969_09850 [Pseudomonas monteilii SB3078]AHC91057.1 hypothetical protein X970_09510 [Pseudomonas monteilii SB3101]KGK25322.1 hypothetical protein GT93_10875 [Pseudomonas plecoglossicida]
MYAIAMRPRAINNEKRLARIVSHAVCADGAARNIDRARHMALRKRLAAPYIYQHIVDITRPLATFNIRTIRLERQTAAEMKQGIGWACGRIFADQAWHGFHSSVEGAPIVGSPPVSLQWRI